MDTKKEAVRAEKAMNKALRKVKNKREVSDKQAASKPKVTIASAL